MRGYIHNNNNNKTNQKKKKTEQNAIHMYPHCKEWFHTKLDQRATPRLWNEVTLSSANRKFIVTGLLLVPPLRPPGFPGACAHTHSHTYMHANTHTLKSIGQSSKTSRKRGGNSSVGHSTFMWRNRLAWQAPIIRRSVTFISSLGQKCATLCLR